MSVKTTWSVTIVCDGSSRTCLRGASFTATANPGLSMGRARAAGWVLNDRALCPHCAAMTVPVAA